MAGMTGKWVEESGWSNMEGILDTVGVTDPSMRGMICSIKPVIELEQDGEVWTYKMITPQSTRVTSFRSGETIDYHSIIGRPVKATISVSDNKIEEVHNDPNDPQEPTSIIREFSGDTMTTTVRVKDVQSTGIYKRAA